MAHHLPKLLQKLHYQVKLFSSFPPLANARTHHPHSSGLSAPWRAPFPECFQVLIIAPKGASPAMGTGTWHQQPSANVRCQVPVPWQDRGVSRAAGDEQAPMSEGGMVRASRAGKISGRSRRFFSKIGKYYSFFVVSEKKMIFSFGKSKFCSNFAIGTLAQECA